MTVWEFAVARAFVQMLDLQTQRPLKPREAECLEILEEAVCRYEGSEMKVVPK